MNNNKLLISIDWKASALVILLLPCLILLGYWQLDRAEQKKAIKAQFKQRVESPAKDIRTTKNFSDLRYQPVRLTGHYLNDFNLLLDNKIYQGKFGYEVLTPFKVANSNWVVWVNRGWLAADSSRRTLPLIPQVLAPIAQPSITIDAEVYVPQSKMMALTELEVPKLIINKPLVVQQFTVLAKAAGIEAKIFPYSVRLKEAAQGVLTRNWVVVNVQPEKHVAYAFQWFSMAAMLIIIGVLANSNLWQYIKHKKQ